MSFVPYESHEQLVPFLTEIGFHLEKESYLLNMQ